MFQGPAEGIPAHFYCRLFSLQDHLQQQIRQIAVVKGRNPRDPGCQRLTASPHGSKTIRQKQAVTYGDTHYEPEG